MIHGLSIVENELASYLQIPGDKKRNLDTIPMVQKNAERQLRRNKI